MGPNIWTILFLIGGYVVYTRMIKPHLLEAGPKENVKESEYVDYEEIEE